MPEINSLIQQITTCTLCALSEKRNRAVPGEGSLAADIVFIGEGPGYYEDRDGRPFVGPAGQLLDQMLASIGLRRPDVYITNMVKCRPPNNREPLPGEIAACKPYLDRQLELIGPKVLVTLGRYSLARFFPGLSISQARGKPRQWRGYVVYPMYHPAAALHNPGLRSTVESDFRRLPSVLEEARRTAKAASVPQPRQLSLFSST